MRRLMSRCLSTGRIARNACQNRILIGCRLSGRLSGEREDDLDFCIRVKIDLVGLGGSLARNRGFSQTGKSFTAQSTSRVHDLTIHKARFEVRSWRSATGCYSRQGHSSRLTGIRLTKGKRNIVVERICSLDGNETLGLGLDTIPKDGADLFRNA